MKRKYLFFLALTCIFASGCRKYVEIEQQGTRTLKYTTDYRYTMNNNSVFEGTFGYPILTGDDTEINDATRQNALNDILGNTYTWGEKFTSATQSDGDWEKLYKAVYTCNEVIAGAMSSEGGTQSQKEQVYAEALVHRAYSYLMLVNLYARQYTPASANTDLGVPLLTTPNLFTSLNRSSVAAVYTLILQDLQASIPKLPATPDYNVRPAKVSAYAILARTYLNMRDFTKAGIYADSALSLQNTLLDLKTYESSPGTIPVRLKDPEIMLSKVVNGSYTAISIDQSLLNSMGATDLRYKLFTNTRGGYGSSFSTAFTGRAFWRYTLNGEYVIVNGPSVPEMMFIKAECQARAGNAAGAMDIINNLRRKRFTDANFTLLSASNANDALELVVSEKRKEFFGTGLRWLDQKRLNLDPAFAQTKNRSFKGASYNLEPNSNRYLYPIGDKYILLNPELEQNPR